MHRTVRRASIHHLADAPCGGRLDINKQVDKIEPSGGGFAQKGGCCEMLAKSASRGPISMRQQQSALKAAKGVKTERTAEHAASGDGGASKRAAAAEAGAAHEGGAMKEAADTGCSLLCGFCDRAISQQNGATAAADAVAECVSCRRSFHLQCLDINPPATRPPAGWRCMDCEQCDGCSKLQGDLGEAVRYFMLTFPVVPTKNAEPESSLLPLLGLKPQLRQRVQACKDCCASYTEERYCSVCLQIWSEDDPSSQEGQSMQQQLEQVPCPPRKQLLRHSHVYLSSPCPRLLPDSSPLPHPPAPRLCHSAAVAVDGTEERAPAHAEAARRRCATPARTDHCPGCG